LSEAQLAALHGAYVDVPNVALVDVLPERLDAHVELPRCLLDREKLLR
jgi:hypothetical protein